MALVIHLPEGPWGPDARSAAGRCAGRSGWCPTARGGARTLDSRRAALGLQARVWHGPIDADEGGEFVACVRLHRAPPKAGAGGRDVRA
jgi:hypothetical protein